MRTRKAGATGLLALLLPLFAIAASGRLHQNIPVRRSGLGLSYPDPGATDSLGRGAYQACVNANEILLGGRALPRRSALFLQLDLHADYPWVLNERMRMSCVGNVFVSLLIFLALGLITSTAMAQRDSKARRIGAEINGQVRLLLGNTPASNVLVKLEEFNSGIISQVMTDGTGKFLFSGISPAPYVLTVRTPGFKEVRQQLSLEAKTTEYVFLRLEPDNSTSASNSTDGGRGVADA